MKIAYVTAFYYPTIGGVEQAVKELAERYVKQGHEVHVFTSDWDKNGRINFMRFSNVRNLEKFLRV